MFLCLNKLETCGKETMIQDKLKALYMEEENKMMLMMVLLCLVIHYKVMIVKRSVKAK